MKKLRVKVVDAKNAKNKKCGVSVLFQQQVRETTMRIGTEPWNYVFVFNVRERTDDSERLVFSLWEKRLLGRGVLGEVSFSWSTLQNYQKENQAQLDEAAWHTLLSGGKHTKYELLLDIEVESEQQQTQSQAQPQAQAQARPQAQPLVSFPPLASNTQPAGPQFVAQVFNLVPPPPPPLQGYPASVPYPTAMQYAVPPPYAMASPWPSQMTGMPPYAIPVSSVLWPAAVPRIPQATQQPQQTQQQQQQQQQSLPFSQPAPASASPPPQPAAATALATLEPTEVASVLSPKSPPIAQLTADELECQTEEDTLFQQYLRSMCQCCLCGKQCTPDSIVSLDCQHNFCEECMHANVGGQITALVENTNKTHKIAIKCPKLECTSMLSERDIKAGSTQLDFDRYEQLLLQQAIASDSKMFSCPNAECKMVMEKIDNNQLFVDESKLRGLDDKPLSTGALQCYKDCRFRCPNCGTIFCAECRATPFHTGFTCANYKTYLAARHCRFCGSQLQGVLNPRAEIADVCAEQECRNKAEVCCTKRLLCGHACNGVRGEAQCPPCMHPDCLKDAQQSADDFCNVCWVESLSAAPCIKLECGHIFHYACIKKKLAERWPSARITFGFCECPLCKKCITHPTLKPLLAPLEALRGELEAKAAQRLVFEGLNNAPELKDPTSPFFKKPTEFAVHRFSYFMCHKCQHPYFAGLKQCGEEREFNPEDLICGGCSGGANATTCPKHGAEYIEFKCQFCCTVASWFCWGTTHFCDQCHQQQLKGVYLNRKPKTDYPVCKGPKFCPLHVAHPHVEEFSLGCVICRNMQSF
eukprot:TRINITY_DN253_c1_g1_i2.p1 TRINITY_DN253_c1_g1~~TRINITY_DN253_c1_g1_i2.p1  ORF type:complete len:811 (+),score=195.14 TRINITY_DN253_c1_g1_i2:140-2572(+)